MGPGCLICLSLCNTATSPTAKQAALAKKEDSSGCTDKQERKDIQAVVLVPGELVSSWSQVLCSFVAHDKFDPEDSSVQRLKGLVMVYLG